MLSLSAHSLALFVSIAEATAFLTAPGGLALQHALLARHSEAGCQPNALSTPAPIARVQHRRMQRSGASNLHASATATMVTPSAPCLFWGVAVIYVVLVLQPRSLPAPCHHDHFCFVDWIYYILCEHRHTTDPELQKIILHTFLQHTSSATMPKLASRTCENMEMHILCVYVQDEEANKLPAYSRFGQIKIKGKAVSVPIGLCFLMGSALWAIILFPYVLLAYAYAKVFDNLRRRAGTLCVCVIS